MRFLSEVFIFMVRYDKWVTIMADLPIAAVARIAKNSGAERVGADASVILAEKAEEFIGDLVKEAVKLAGHAGRKTLKAEDIEIAAEKFE